jgi:hypothetical protein
LHSFSFQRATLRQLQRSLGAWRQFQLSANSFAAVCTSAAGAVSQVSASERSSGSSYLHLLRCSSSSTTATSTSASKKQQQHLRLHCSSSSTTAALSDFNDMSDSDDGTTAPTVFMKAAARLWLSALQQQRRCRSSDSRHFDNDDGRVLQPQQFLHQRQLLQLRSSSCICNDGNDGAATGVSDDGAVWQQFGDL